MDGPAVAASAWGAVGLTVAGAVIIMVVLRDLFHTLFHPGGSASFPSQGVIRMVWRATRLTSRGRVSPIAAPLAVVVTILAWAFLVTLGWALVYWARMPDGIAFGPGISPEDGGGFLGAVYLSLVTLGTLGYGDLVPTDTSLRLIAPVQALIGFALLSAAIAWILSLYPAVARLRSLARDVRILLRSLAEAPGLPTASRLEGIAIRLTRLRADFLLFSSLVYFRTGDADDSLPVALLELVDLCDEVGAADDPDVARAAQELRWCIGDVADVVALEFPHAPDRDARSILLAYARAHGDPGPDA
jgi:hypothetical protein